MRRIHDVTLAFTVDLPAWPGDPTPEIGLHRSLAQGDSCSITKLSTHVHFGTHVDAPRHFIPEAKGVDEIPLDVLVGPAWVAVLDEVSAIDAADLEALDLAPGTTRLLLRTRNSRLWDDPAHEFQQDFVALTGAAARWVVERGIRLIGIDYLSIERFRAPGHPAHMALLGAEVVVIEGLDLRAVAAGSYELVCLPLKIKGADGAPARVILIEPSRPS
jgi:arylformamidase